MTDRDAELVETNGCAATGIDQKLLVAGFDQRAWTETLRARDPRAGPEQGHPEIAGLVHWCIFIPESLTTFTQRATWDFTRLPYSAGVPPAGSAPILAKDSRTGGAESALLTAWFSRAVTSLGVPLLTEKPTQSPTTRFGYPSSTIVG